MKIELQGKQPRTSFDHFCMNKYNKNKNKGLSNSNVNSEIEKGLTNVNKILRNSLNISPNQSKKIHQMSQKFNENNLDLLDSAGVLEKIFLAETHCESNISVMDPIKSLKFKPVGIKSQLTKREKKNIYLANKEIQDRKVKKFQKVFDSFSEDEKKSMKVISIYVIHPNNIFKNIWDLAINILILYSIFLFPFNIAFENSDSLVNSIVDICVDIIFIIDVILTFFSAYYDNDENLITNLGDIALNYIKSWFFLDLISSIPFELFALIFNFDSIHNISNLSKYYRLIKWVRIFRGMKLTKKKKNNNDSFFISKYFDKLSESLKRMIKFIAFIILFVHIMSCFYIFIGKNSQVYDYNWISENDLTLLGNSELYLCSLYFICATIFTIGYGDITPRSTYEILYITFVLSIGCGIFSYALSSISSFLVKNDSRTQKYDKYVEILREIDADYKLPRDLYEQLEKSFNVLFENSSEEMANFASNLPSTIKNDLFFQMYKKQIQTLNFFNNQSYEFIVNVIPLLKSVEFNKDTIIIAIGDIVREMYLVFKGCLSINMSEKFNEIEIALIKSGNHFGDILMFLDEQSSYNLKVKSKYSQLMILKKNDFARIRLEFSKGVNEIIMNSVKNFETIEKRRKIVIDNFRSKSKKKFKFKVEFFDEELEEDNIQEKIASDIIIDNKMLTEIKNIMSEDLVDKEIIYEQEKEFIKGLKEGNTNNSQRIRNYEDIEEGSKKGEKYSLPNLKLNKNKSQEEFIDAIVETHEDLIPKNIFYSPEIHFPKIKKSKTQKNYDELNKNRPKMTPKKSSNNIDAKILGDRAFKNGFFNKNHEFVENYLKGFIDMKGKESKIKYMMSQIKSVFLKIKQINKN